MAGCLTKDANCKQNDSYARCFDANFEQQEKCARCFPQALPSKQNDSCKDCFDANFENKKKRVAHGDSDKLKLPNNTGQFEAKQQLRSVI